MIKGVVIKVKPDYSIILGEGQFYRIKNKKGIEEGQKIFVTDEDVIKNRKNIINKSYKKYIGIAAILMIISTLILSLNIRKSVYAVATIDINPSIELSLDKELKVMKMKSKNKDGKDFEKLKLKGLNVEDALEIIVVEARNKGFIKSLDDSYVLVTTIKLKETVKKPKQQIEEKVKNSETLKQVTIAITNTTKKVYKENKKENIPLGIKAIDNKIDKNEYKSLNEYFKEKKNLELFKKKGKIIQNINKEVEEIKHESKKIENSIKELKNEKEKIKKEKYSDKKREKLEEKLEKREEHLEEIQDDLEDKIEDYEDYKDDIEDKEEEDDDDEENEDDESDREDDDEEDD